MLNGNRRTFHIYLTKEGWKSQKLVEESFLEIEKQALKGITEEEFDAYLTFSRKIFKNLMLTEEEGPTDAFVEKVSEKVRDWLYYHIQTFDRSVAEFKFMRDNAERI